MKKFGFVVLGLALAVSVSAQPQPPHHEQGDNKANLNQFGFSQWGFITQYGEDNKATINQGFLFAPHEAMPIMNPTWSFGNTAFIMQIGEDHEATINQVGHGNLAVLTQMREMDHHPGILENGPRHEGAEGVITQWGSHNITSILQLPGSTVNIMQGGTHNFIGGFEHMPQGAFCAPLPDFEYNQTCPIRPAIFPTLVVDEGVTVNLTQTGQGEYFFGIGKIRGDRKISQGNTLWHHPEANNNNHHNELDFNAIWLEQAGGFADLTQNGKYNRMWLDIDVTGNHGPHVANGEPEHHGPYVKVTQIGYKNMVAKFQGPCFDCHNILGPAEFDGDHLIVLQNGYKNKLSIDSKGEGNNITVNQIGMYNYGSIVQGGMMPPHP